MRKVLLIQNVISDYRVPVYNLIAKEFDLTVLYSEGKVPERVEFKTMFLKSCKKGPVTLYKKGLDEIMKPFDVVIYPYDPMQISIIYEMFKSKWTHKHKFVPWGIGVPASYDVSYDAPRKSSRLCYYLAKWSDATIFYSDYPKNKYTRMGINPDKMFVAHNTVVVNKPECDQKEKDCLLFVGSLYKQKGIGTLLDSYKKAIEIEPDMIPLYIIGSGSEHDNLVKTIEEYGIGDKVFLMGAIYDEKELSSYFQRARACISPKQAGLSVQKSMGYGVPFVTKKDSVTGGEIFDIENGRTGVLYEEDERLSDILLDIHNNPKKYLTMGAVCEKFYKQNRTVELMAKGAIDAINYVVNS